MATMTDADRKVINQVKEIAQGLEKAIGACDPFLSAAKQSQYGGVYKQYSDKVRKTLYELVAEGTRKFNGIF